MRKCRIEKTSMSVKFGRVLRLRPRPRFYLLLTGLVLSGLLLSAALAGLRIRQLDQRLDALRNQRASRIERLQALKARLEYVETDAYIEEIARKELNLLYPGEILYIAGRREESGSLLNP